jgi:hypothetical protein
MLAAVDRDLQTCTAQDGPSRHKAPGRRSSCSPYHCKANPIGPLRPEEHEKPGAQLHSSRRKTTRRKPPLLLRRSIALVTRSRGATPPNPQSTTLPSQGEVDVARGSGRRRLERPHRHRHHQSFAWHNPWRRQGRGGGREGGLEVALPCCLTYATWGRCIFP